MQHTNPPLEAGNNNYASILKRVTTILWHFQVPHKALSSAQSERRMRTIFRLTEGLVWSIIPVPGSPSQVWSKPGDT